MRSLILTVLALFSTPAAAQIVTSPTAIADTNGDGKIGLDKMAAKVTPMVPRGTVVVPCGKVGALFAYGIGKCVVAAPVEPAKPTQRFGVNLSGCEFGSKKTVNGVVMTVYTTAMCPNEADIDWYAKVGFQLIRLPVKDVHLTDPAMLARVVTIVRYAQSKGLQVILDRHTYQYYTPAQNIAFWTPILPRFSPDSTMIELSNEPVKGYPEGNKWDLAAAALSPTVQGIRDAGFSHRILVGWPGWNAIFRADKNEAAHKTSDSFFTALDRVGGLRDPLNRTFMSGHRYFDKGASGTNKTCVSVGDGGVAAWAEAMRKRKLKGYLTEFGLGNKSGIPVSCQPLAEAVFGAIKNNSDVILGTAAWGGGRAWPESYAFKLEPKKGTRETSSVPAFVRDLAGLSDPRSFVTTKP